MLTLVVGIGLLLVGGAFIKSITKVVSKATKAPAKAAKATPEDEKLAKETNWGKGSYNSPGQSLKDHYAKHGKEVGAKTEKQYADKAEAFAKNAKKGVHPTKVKGETPDVYRYRKNGNYVDIQKGTNKIISFGKK